MVDKDTGGAASRSGDSLAAEGASETSSISDAAAIALGAEIRRLRRMRGLTLSALSHQAGRSIGYLSQVERGLSTLSIKALKDISDALGVPIGWFFPDHGTGAAEERDVVVRAGGRRKLTFGTLGITDYLLSPSLDGKLELLVCQIAPGASSGEEPYSHDGEEAGLLLGGCLELWVGERRFLLHRGDSFSFPSTTPHRYRNPGEEETVVVWAITPPSF